MEFLYPFGIKQTSEVFAIRRVFIHKRGAENARNSRKRQVKGNKMTDKELRKLHREDLLQILISQQRQIDELTAALEDSENALNDKKIALEESGNIAEAALRLSGIFETAQQAADQYTAEVRARADEIVAQAKAEAERILSQARGEARRNS